jgi:hypothetical protein
MGAEVVANNEAGVGPAHKYGTAEDELIYDSGDIVGPKLRLSIILRFERGLRHAVTAQVQGYEAKILGKHALILVLPAEMVL